MIVGLGMDVVEIARMRALLARHPARARRKLFTPVEIAYAEGRADPLPHYAARFAAKEAAYKALAGTAAARAISWQDIEVVSGADGRPSLRLHGRAAARAAELGVSAPWVTLTHDGGIAAATVVLDGDPGPDPAPAPAARGP